MVDAPGLFVSLRFRLFLTFAAFGSLLTLGSLWLARHQAPSAPAVAQPAPWHLMLLLLGILCASALLAWWLNRWILSPLLNLQKGLRNVQEGQLDLSTQIDRKDELGLLNRQFHEMIESLRAREFLKSTLECYVSRPVAQRIFEQQDALQLGGEEREVTILFADIRRFTALAEALPPTRVVEILNAYFTRVITMVGENEGMVDKLMGDSIMALFGAPLPLEDAPFRAIECALSIQRAVEEINLDQARLGLPPIEMGIGINTGTVVAGNIGSSVRMDYTVIGDNVNVAARLQGLAGPGEIYISQATYEQTSSRLRVSPLEPMTLKGRQNPVRIFRVEGLAGEDQPSA